MDDLPPSSATSRIGTCTFCAPSTRTFVELGNAVAKSDMPLSLHPPTPGTRANQVPRVCSQSRAGYPWRLRCDYIKGKGQRAKGKGRGQGQRAQGEGDKARRSAQAQEVSPPGLGKSFDGIA